MVGKKGFHSLRVRRHPGRAGHAASQTAAAVINQLRADPCANGSCWSTAARLTTGTSVGKPANEGDPATGAG